MSDKYRIERDTMGEMRVPVGRLIWTADAAGRREFPDQRAPSSARVHPRTRIDKGVRGQGEWPNAAVEKAAARGRRLASTTVNLS